MSIDQSGDRSGSSETPWSRFKRDRFAILQTPWPWLGYLIIYFFPWFFRTPGEQELVLTAVVLPVFLCLYIIGFKAKGPAAFWFVGGIALLGLVSAPIMPSSSVFIVFATAMAGRLRPRKLAIIGLIGVLAPFAALSLWLDYPTIFILTGLFFGTMVGVGCIADAELQAKNTALKASQEETRAMAIAAERERIARDMHDVLGHSLSVIAVKAELSSKIIDHDIARAKEELADIHRTARQALSDVRATITGMKSTTLVSEIAQARRALSAADIDLLFSSESTSLPAFLEETVTMVIREAVTNVIRHSNAKQCSIKLLGDDDALILVIEDDGEMTAEHPQTAKEGNGLSGMRARVEAVSGQFNILRERGMRLEVILPLPTEP